jgi:hypothetical protein
LYNATTRENERKRKREGEGEVGQGERQREQNKSHTFHHTASEGTTKSPYVEIACGEMGVSE